MEIYGEPVWGFASLGRSASNDDADADADDDVFDDAASNAPNLGSAAGDELDERLLTDFSDDLMTHDGMVPGMSTPLEQYADEEVPTLLGGEDGDGEVADVRLDDEGVGVGAGVGVHGKVE